MPESIIYPGLGQAIQERIVGHITKRKNKINFKKKIEAEMLEISIYSLHAEEGSETRL